MEPERKKIIKKKPTIDKPPTTQSMPTTKRKYTEADIHELIVKGYIAVLPDLWDKIPTGAHIRYTKKDTGDRLPRCERFKPGGFVRNHFKTDGDKSMFTLETIPGGSYKYKGGNYFSFPVAYDDIEELWKKIDYSSFIEILLIKNSLSQKSQKIDELESRIDTLEEILRSAIRK